MKKTITLVILLLFFSLTIVFAATYPKPYDDYVNDFAKVFTSEQTGTLRTILSEVMSNTTAEVVVITISDLQGEDISQYTTNLGQNWGVGKKDKDNGLVILYSVKEKKIFAATGYGLEGILPDSKVGRLLDDYYVPLRDSNKTADGIVSFTNEITKVIIQNADEVKSGKAGGVSVYPILVVIIILFLIVGLFAYFVSRIGKSKGFGDFFTFFFIDFIIRMIIMSLIFKGGRGRSSDGGFGSGGGGGSFGGGGFGGGGAGR